MSDEISAYGQGHVLLHRSLLDSSLWMMRNEDLRLAITLLCSVNWKDREWFNKWEHKRVIVKRGEIITSREALAARSRLTVQQVRTSTKHLIEDGFIEVVKNNEKSTSNFTHLRICKYDTYQIDFKNLTSDQPGINPASTRHQPQMNKDNKDNKGKKDIETTVEDSKGRLRIRPSEPSPAMLQYAKDNGCINPQAIFEIMLDKVDEKGEKVADWNAKYRTFIRNGAKYNPEFFSNGNGHQTCSKCNNKPYVDKDGDITACPRCREIRR